MATKRDSTYTRILRDKKRRTRFEARYAEFLLSEVILDLMKQEEISVRSLAKKIGISPTVIQDIRSGKRANVTVKNLLSIATSLGARLKIEKGKMSYYLTTE